MANSDIREHISAMERDKWDKNIVDFNLHVGSGGDNNHVRANGTVSGFTINDYTWAEKNKLAGIEAGALNNPHPATHPYTMITGLSTVAHTGKYSDLIGIPSTFIAGGGNADTVRGISIYIQTSTPANPTNDKAVWFDMSTRLVKVYHNNVWTPMCAVFG